MKKILIIFLILIGLYLAFTNLIRFDWFPFGNHEQQATVTDKVDMINVDISSASTTIIPEERKDIKAELTGQGKVIVDHHGNEISISVKRKWFTFFSFSREKLTIYIPKDYEKRMEIHIGSGSLDFSGKSPEEPMKLTALIIDMSSGNLKLNNLDVQQYKHDLSSGNVKINSLTTRTGEFEISSGNMEILNYLGGIDAELSSGDLAIQMDKLTDDIEIEVSSGNVELDLPKRADFTLNGKASSGNITCNFPLTSNETSNKTIKGSHGSGKYNINLQVSSGDIRIH